jgi:bifunctional DNA-binding transcriptional regulator/antitoxin component of YhaV-PrlF toxin-antitoxin module
VGVMPMITTVNRRGQVTIPKSLHDRYGFPPGTKVVWLERDADLIPKPLLPVEQLRGRLKGEELTAILLEERARDRTHEDGLSRRAPDPVLTGDPEFRVAEELGVAVRWLGRRA